MDATEVERFEQIERPTQDTRIWGGACCINQACSAGQGPT